MSRMWWRRRGREREQTVPDRDPAPAASRDLFPHPSGKVHGLQESGSGATPEADLRCGGSGRFAARAAGGGACRSLQQRLGLSFEKCSDVYHTAFGIEVSQSGLCHALHRLAAAAEPTYDALIESLKQAPVVSPDETGWKVGGELVWLWASATPGLSVYAIQDGRGFEQAASVLGTDFGGALIRDGWAPYRRFEEALHQSCLADIYASPGPVVIPFKGLNSPELQPP
jgi:hypothetical protein